MPVEYDELEKSWLCEHCQQDLLGPKALPQQITLAELLERPDVTGPKEFYLDPNSLKRD